MGDAQKAAHKAAKKAAKAQAKTEKKRATGTAGTPVAGEAGSGTSDDRSGPSRRLPPAERSAAAAERQVRLQRFRVIIALFALVLSAAALLLTLRPWQSWSAQGNSAQPETAPTSQPITDPEEAKP